MADPLVRTNCAPLTVHPMFNMAAVQGCVIAAEVVGMGELVALEPTACSDHTNIEARWDTGQLGAIAVRVDPVDADVPVPVVDGWFRHDASLRALAVRCDGGIVLLTRERLEFELAGPFGYGRNLYARKTVRALLPSSTLVLHADTPLTAAGAAILVRVDGERYSDVLVSFDDGSLGIVTVAAVFARLAQIFETIAAHDPLTNLPNRRVLEHISQRALIGGGAGKIALLYVDLDRFKDVNDMLGHRAGDQVLVEFARRLRECTRDGDLVVRLGGDEFAVLLINTTPVSAHAAAERIVLNAAAPFVIDDRVVTLGASVGVAFPAEAMTDKSVTTIDALIRQADAAMYQAKRNGQGVLAVTDTSEIHNEQRNSAAAIAHRIRPAMAEGLFQLHYQPIIDVASGAIVEMEALLRWHDTELGTLAPADFIPVAERSGHIVELGRWVIYQACRDAQQWAEAGTDRSVAVNLSPVQLMDPELVTYVTAQLVETGLPARLLRFEVTETEAIRDVNATSSRLRELQALGVRLSLDDFGTGHSSLAMLSRLPVDTIKIDRSFIDRIDARTTEASFDAALVRLIIETARLLGLNVVAEGVERDSQLGQLAGMGCSYAQGYLLGRPGQLPH